MSATPSVQEIQAQQGTRLNEETPPWMSYAAELNEQLDPELEAQVEEYAQQRYDDGQTSSQNQEELCRQQELNDGVAAQYRWLDPKDYADEEARIGRPMSYDWFITRLRNECKLKCGYRPHPQADKLTLVCFDPQGMRDPEVACWVQYGVMPEFEMVRFDEHNVVLDTRRRGWRTCLLQMILKGMLTEETVDRVFGKAIGPASERYNATLYSWRKRRFEKLQNGG